MKKYPIIAVAAIALLASSCQSFAGAIGDAVGGTEGKVLKAAIESAPDVMKALETITPEQEYYIGRAVGAQVFASYKPYDRAALNSYLNKLGQGLALYSERPEIFGGYRFVALDSDEINAFATPSGLVTVSRGLLRLTTREDELAALLAHEICHITERHGLKSIKSARFGKALGTVASKAGEALAGDELKEVTGAFTDTIGDITKTMIVNGYSKSAEYDADAKAVALLARAGYDPRALARVLAAMEKKLDPAAKDFSKTHPKPADRIKAVKAALDAAPAKVPAPTKARSDRYAAALKNA